MKPVIFILLLAVTCFTCNFYVDQSIAVQDGDIIEKSQNTMNGDIDVGLNSKVDGDCRSVNGCVSVQEFGRVHHVQTVNGNVNVGRQAKIEGNIESVNGNVFCQDGVRILGNVRTVEGNIECEQTYIYKSIYTNQGNIFLKSGSILDGDIVIQGPDHLLNSAKTVEVKILEGSTVKGNIKVLDLHQRVLVYLATDSHIEGGIQNAELVRMESGQISLLN